MRVVPRIGPYVTAGAVLAVGLVFAATTAFACGYHNPSDIARGTMNFIYPKSLYVRTAVWQAQNSGLLPPRPRRVVKDLFAYQRATAGLEELGKALGAGPNQQFGFTVVLLDSMLWTRYAAGDEGFGVTVHVSGPSKNEAVVVTEGAVVRALNAGVITYDVAESQGLIRLYGPKEQQETLRAVMRSQREDAYSDAPDGATEAAG
ncbi:MAG: hypothetical protein PVF41_00360 [Methyloceanibacter sp.]